MSKPILHALIQNAALLLALVTVFDVTTSRRQLEGKLLRQTIVGLILGGLGIALVQTSFRLESGIVFDTRSVLLAVCGLFMGVVPTTLAMLMTAAFRLSQGGAAAWPGVAVIFASGGIGLAWRHYRRSDLTRVSWQEFYGLGIVVHGVMLALMLMLPWESARRVLLTISLPVMLIYPVATMILGLLLANRVRREESVFRLAESEARYRGLFDLSPEGIIILDPETARILEFNEVAHRQLGYTRKEFAGLSGTDLDAVNTADETRSRMLRALQGERIDFETRHRSRSGEIREVQVSARVTQVSGRPVIYCLCHDITERKRTEAALQANAALMRMASRMARFGGWSVELATQRVTWSEEVAAIHGVPPGHSPTVEEGIQFYAPEWQPSISKLFQVCAQEGTPYDEEMEILTAQRQRLWVRTMGEAVRDKSGRITHLQGTFQDITERKESEVKQAERLDELLRWREATLGRESRVLELKAEVNALLGRLGEPCRYPSATGRSATET